MENAPFALQTIPNKGKGLVATRPIAKGELILEESPLFVQQQRYYNATIVAALADLSDTDQRGYFSLANGWGGNVPPALGIFRTNALPCGDNDAATGAAAEEAGIFLLGSRFNSSCEPNVNNYWNAQSRQITFRSVRDIEEGEELCICYSQILATRDDRRAKTESAFHFTCKCVACMREGAELKDSDERRVTISRLYGEIGQCGSNPSLGVRKVRMALRHLVKENLNNALGASYCYDAAQFCISVSDVRNAKAWLFQAHELYCIGRGPQSEEALKMAALLKDPRTHRAFGMLPKRSLVGPE